MQAQVPSELTGHLIAAAANGDIVSVVGLVEAGLADKDSDYNGRTPLYAAAFKGQMAVVQWLVSQAHADISKPTGHGVTPLLAAIHHGFTAVATWLVANGADIEKSEIIDNQKGSTPLNLAASLGNLPLVRTLVEKGADKEAQGASQSYPLVSAIWGGHTEVVKYLIGSGVSLASKVPGGRTPLWVAILQGHEEIVRALFDGGADMEWIEEGDIVTALQTAVPLGRLSTVQCLIGAGADLDKGTPPLGKNPLLFAAETGSLEIVKALVEGGANVNATTIKGDTPLSVAAMECSSKQHLEIVQYLASAGADIEMARETMTPLINAAARDKEEVARFDFSHFQAI